MHPIHLLAPGEPTQRHRAPAHRPHGPRRSLRVRLDDGLVAVGRATARLGSRLAAHGVRRGGAPSRPRTTSPPPGHLRSV